MDITALFFPIFNLSRGSEILDKLMIFGADYVILFTILLVIFLFFKGHTRERKAPFLIVLAFLIGYALVEIIRIFYQEPRPFTTFRIYPLIAKVDALSFPSTHTLTMAVIAFTYYYYHSKFAPLFILLLLWVGFARIYVGVHYPFDILGGMAVGLVSVHLAWIFKNYLKTKISKL